jgi:hypothetical protein
MRVVTITQDANLQTLRSLLVDSRLGGARSDAVLETLQAANPHADLTNLRAGTVLFVPEGAGFRGSASTSAGGGAFSDFQQIVRNALGQAGETLKAASAARGAERTTVAGAVATPAVQRAIATDHALAQQVGEGTKALEDDLQQAQQAERALAEASRAALATLADLAKLLG